MLPASVATGGTTLSPSLGAGTSSSAAPMIAVTEELERVRRELEDQSAAASFFKEELRKLQRRYVFMEYDFIESQTSLAMVARAAEEDRQTNEETIDRLQQSVDRLSAAAAPSQMHAAVMLQVERLIPSLLLEVMNHVLRRSTVDPSELTSVDGANVSLIPPLAVEAVRGLQTVSAIAELRLWVRKLIDADRDSLIASASRRHQTARSAEAAKLLRSFSFAKQRGGGESGVFPPVPDDGTPTPAANQRRHSVASPEKVRPADASVDSAVVEQLKNQNATLQKELDEMRRHVREADDEVSRTRQATQASLAAAKRDMQLLRSSLRSKGREIENLKDAAKRYADRNELNAALDQVTELKQQIHDGNAATATAIQVRTGEFEAANREKEERIAELENRLQRLGKIQTRQKNLEVDLNQARQELVNVKQQLSRVNLRGMLDDKLRQELRVKRVMEEHERSQRELRHTQAQLTSLRTTSQKLTAQYNEIFEAKLAEAQRRAAAKKAQDISLGNAAVAGPNSELNAQYFQVRYQEALAELKKSQKKLKHLIFLSHHDHLSFHLQREDLSQQLREAKRVMQRNVKEQPNDGDEDGDSDDEKDDARIVDRLIMEQGGPSSPSPNSDALQSPLREASADDEFSFQAFVDRSLGGHSQARHQTPPASSAASRSVVAGRMRPRAQRGLQESDASTSPGGVYDIISSECATHLVTGPIVGIRSTEGHTMVENLANPLDSGVTAIVSSHRRPGSAGGSMELSIRSVVPSEATGLSTAPSDNPKMLLNDGSVVEEHIELRERKHASRLQVRSFSQRNAAPITYMRKNRMASPVGSLLPASTQPSQQQQEHHSSVNHSTSSSAAAALRMTPVPRPASALL